MLLKIWPFRSISTNRATSSRKVIANTRHSVISPEHVARMMNVGLDKAKEILRVTTQNEVYTAIHPIHRRYKTDHININRVSHSSGSGILRRIRIRWWEMKAPWRAQDLLCQIHKAGVGPKIV